MESDVSEGANTNLYAKPISYFCIGASGLELFLFFFIFWAIWSAGFYLNRGYAEKYEIIFLFGDSSDIYVIPLILGNLLYITC